MFDKPSTTRLRHVDLENEAYHVSTVSRARLPLFAKHRNATIVLEAIQFIRARALVLAFALMPDHLHALVEPRSGEKLSAIMQSIKGYNSRAINRQGGTKGQLWQQGFYDRMIRGERHLFEVIDYVEENPVKAGLCDEASGYRYSSAGRSDLTDLVEYVGG